MAAERRGSAAVEKAAAAAVAAVGVLTSATTRGSSVLSPCCIRFLFCENKVKDIRIELWEVDGRYSRERCAGERGETWSESNKRQEAFVWQRASFFDVFFVKLLPLISHLHPQPLGEATSLLAELVLLVLCQDGQERFLRFSLVVAEGASG